MPLAPYNTSSESPAIHAYQEITPRFYNAVYNSFVETLRTDAKPLEVDRTPPGRNGPSYMPTANQENLQISTRQFWTHVPRMIDLRLVVAVVVVARFLLIRKP